MNTVFKAVYATRRSGCQSACVTALTISSLRSFVLQSFEEAPAPVQASAQLLLHECTHVASVAACAAASSACSMAISSCTCCSCATMSRRFTRTLLRSARQTWRSELSRAAHSVAHAVASRSLSACPASLMFSTARSKPLSSRASSRSIRSWYSASLFCASCHVRLNGK
eukprot:365688-Chlamydomonas_euryale.AAC.18